jgi:uncharacterized protein YecE (DUF72 family)
MNPVLPAGLHIGTCGWWYDDWRPILFPGPAKVDALRFMAERFNALEINVSFYRPIAPAMAASWLRRVERIDGFVFTAKLHQRFTHQRDEPLHASEVQEFLAGIEPLQQAGRLAALLAQFPWSCKDQPEERTWLTQLCAAFHRVPLVVELRHDSWLTSDALDFLRTLNVGFCDIDQPGHRHGIPPLDLVLGAVGYVRLHGRNHARWFDHEEAWQRYDYLYTPAELDEWLPRIRRIHSQAETTFVFTNNHFRAQAVANGLELVSKLTRQPVDVPPGLLAEYPELGRFARSVPHERQGKLF